MKVKVIREFRDREHDLKLRKKEEEFEVPEKRAEKLESLGFVTRIEKPSKKKTPEAQKGDGPEISH